MQDQGRKLAKRILFAYGTRPEWIKIAPVVKEAKNRGHHVSVVKVLQH
jgi:UDP-N-acetylglucosamine 2-epimerase